MLIGSTAAAASSLAILQPFELRQSSLFLDKLTSSKARQLATLGLCIHLSNKRIIGHKKGEILLVSPFLVYSRCFMLNELDTSFRIWTSD